MGFLLLYKHRFFIFLDQSEKFNFLFFFVLSSTMDQGGSSLGLAPFVRCPVDKLLSMNSVRAFKMILRLFIRTLSESFCFSRRVSSSGLYGRRSSAQSRSFLSINIHNIGAKVRAVELTGKKSCHPICILVFSHS